MNKLQLEELRDVVLTLCDIFKCAVCTEVLQHDTLSCVNGHCICAKCKGKQDICPSCRNNFSNIEQNSIVRQVLEVIPHTCRYKKCSYLVTAEDDHELYCGCKPTLCKNCAWEGPAVGLNDHFKEDHPEKVVFLEKTLPIRTFCEDLQTRLTVTSQFSVYGHFLWLVEDLDPTSAVLCFTFIPVFCGKPTHDVFMKISFKSEEKEYRVGTRIKMEANVDPTKENCLLVPTSVLHHFYNKEAREFTYSVFITKSKRRIKQT